MVFSGFASFIQYHFIFSLILLLWWERLTLLNLLLAIPFNFLCNFYLIFFLVSIRCYTSECVWSIFAAEILALLFFAFQKRKKRVATIEENVKVVWRIPSCSLELWEIVLFIIGIGGSAYAFLRYVKSFGDIFYSWDGIVSWNCWATDWFSNIVPQKTYFYPQLHSALLSLSYAFIGTAEIPLFTLISANLILVLIGLLPLIWAFSLPKGELRLTALVMSILFPYVAKNLTEMYSQNGYADAPLFYLALIMVILFVTLNENIKKKKSDHFWVFLMIMTMATASLIKYTGVYLILTFVLMNFYLPVRNKKWLVYGVISAVLLILPWVVYQIFFLPVDPVKMGNVLYNITPGPFWSRPFQAAALIFKTVTFTKSFFLRILIYIFGGCCLWMGIRKNRFNQMMLICGVIFFLIWGFWSSYDTRNFAIGAPFFFFVISWGFGKSLVCLAKTQRKIILQSCQVKKMMVYVIAIITSVVILMTLAIIFPSEKIIESQMNKRMSYGYPEINKILYQAIDKDPSVKILTTNDTLVYNPKMRERTICMVHSSLDQALKQYPDYNYLLIGNINTEKFAKEIAHFVATGKIVPIKIESDGVNGLYQIKRN